MHLGNDGIDRELVIFGVNKSNAFLENSTTIGDSMFLFMLNFIDFLENSTTIGDSMYLFILIFIDIL